VDKTAVSWTKVSVDVQYQILLKTIEYWRWVSDYTDNMDVTPLFNAQVYINIHGHTQHIALQSYIT